LTPELLNDFSIIEQADQRLVKTIDSILEMSQIQLGTYKASIKKIDLVVDVLKKLEGHYLQAAEKKGLACSFIYASDHAVISCDSLSISKIFSCLLDNSINFTQDGEISLHLECKSEGGIHVSVTDTGIGISKEFLSQLFEPFRQEEQGFQRKYEGNGLSLALAKKYCELNNATIGVESEKGIGTKITITFAV
jgi:signal transduction histidine kinase